MIAIKLITVYNIPQAESSFISSVANSAKLHCLFNTSLWERNLRRKLTKLWIVKITLCSFSLPYMVPPNLDEVYLSCLPVYQQLVGQMKNVWDANKLEPDCGTLFGLLERRRQSTLLSPHSCFQSKAKSLWLASGKFSTEVLAALLNAASFSQCQLMHISTKNLVYKH